MESSKKGIDRYSTFGLRDEWMPLSSVTMWASMSTLRYLLAIAYSYPNKIFLYLLIDIRF